MFSQGFASAKCLDFRKLSQICFRSNTKVLQALASMISQALASFRSNSQIWFRSFSQAFASFRNSWFRKLSQGFANGLSQPFAKDLQVRKSWFFARIRDGHFADEAQAEHHIPVGWMNKGTLGHTTVCSRDSMMVNIPSSCAGRFGSRQNQHSHISLNGHWQQDFQ